MKPAASRRKWHLARRWVFLAVVSLLSTLMVGVHGAAPAAAATNDPTSAAATNAPLSQTSIITNNIQGSSTDADSKWTTMVNGFFRTADIVLIQEAGPSGPPGSHPQAPIQTDGNTVQHYLWPVGQSLAQVYFLQTDGGTAAGGRVNVAIVTHAVPDEVRVVENPVQPGRAALGVRFGNNWYFNLHGLSGGGNDSGVLLGAIATAVHNWGANYTYTVGGDFNRDPSNLTIPSGSRILSTGQATQQSGGELDYFVTDDPASPAAGPTRLNGSQSDHYPVMLGAMQAAAGTPPLKVMADGDNAPAYVATFGTVMVGLLAALSTVSARSVDFVGDETTSNGTHYEDTPGEEISGVASQDAAAIPKDQPNVVLLQAGTWDIQDGDQSGAADRLSALIDQIQDKDPTTVVMVSTLNPTTNAADESLVTGYNTAVQQMVAAKVADGRRVVLADMSALTTADLNSDGVTPNTSGDQKMAASFAGALLWAQVMGWLTEARPASAPDGSVCDIYAYYGTPCVGAYSMTRAMYSGYDGPLYQVTRASDGATDNIGLLSAGGDVNASQQDSFCAATTCTVTMVYDQSPQLNDLTISPGGSANPNPDHGADATALPITVGGHKAYGLDITPGTGYRDNDTRGVATTSEPEGMYMVASGTNVNSGCCFDFGNAEINTHDNGNGHMDAVNFSTTCYFAPCTGGGPWVEADMENGLFQGGNGSNTANTGLVGDDFVTAMLNNDGQSTYSLAGGNAQSGGLSTWWNGSLPTNATGYKPMRKEGAIVLGTGGDNSNSDVGSFFEGVMTYGYPSAAAGNAVQANITAAGYAGNSGGQAGSAPEAAGAALTHSGYTSVYTVNAANNHLEESYLSNIGNTWATHDLNALAGTPPVMAGTKPVSLFHCGYTSVFTIDASNGDLQETYLSNIGAPWATHDLTAMAHTPPSHVTPTAALHTAGATGQAAACGYTSVYTVDASTGDLQETYLPYVGDTWTTQDLSSEYHTPAVLGGTSPVALVHGGYTSVFTVDADHHLQETYLSNIGNVWATHDLNTLAHTPPTTVTPTAVVHYAGATGPAAASGYTSVYTVDDSNGDLQETFLPYIGDSWTTQDLSANYHTPTVAPGTQPEALYHTGYTSVFTVDRSNDHVQETYLSNIGNVWATHDLTTLAHTPTTADSPVVLLHPAANGALTWTSVYTMNESDNHLQETYLPAIGDNWTTQDLSAKYGTPPVRVMQFPTSGWSLAHAGYTSAFTVNKSNGHLQETYQSGISSPWATHDLNTLAGTPPVAGPGVPASLYHAGYTSVFTVDASNGHLQETYLANIGAPWATHDLSDLAGTPPVQTGTSAAAVFHDGYVSVFTVDAGTGDLQETYLSNIGGTWATHDLTAMAHTPPAADRTSPATVVHSGYTSVYTVDSGSGHLQETYLPAIGASWATQDLTAATNGPAVDQSASPSAVVHSGYTSVFTVDAGDNHLQETYLSALGDNWATHDLSDLAGTPAVASTVVEAPAALYHTGYTSVFTIDSGSNDVQETYLSNIGNTWATHDLTEIAPDTPPANQPPTALLHYDSKGGLTFTSIFTVNKSDLDLNETSLAAIGDDWSSENLNLAAGTPPV